MLLLSPKKQGASRLFCRTKYKHEIYRDKRSITKFSDLNLNGLRACLGFDEFIFYASFIT